MRSPRLAFARKLYRAVSVVLVFAFCIVELVVTRPRTRMQRAAWLSRLSGRVLRTVDISYTPIGAVPDHGAIISNHLSYVDILVHSALHPCVFVSKAELRKTPVLGWMSMMAGTVYVTRGAGGSAQKAAEGMAKGFRDGLPVVFFPEGTTGVGDVPVMPFHSGLLAQALDAGAPIVPAFVSYQLAAVDLAEGRTARNDVHWGPQTLPAHLWNLCGLHAIHVTVRFAAAPIAFTEAALKNRKRAAEEARTAVLELSETAPEGSFSR